MQVKKNKWKLKTCEMFKALKLCALKKKLYFYKIDIKFSCINDSNNVVFVFKSFDHLSLFFYKTFYEENDAIF